ncbi:hypothetical protein NT845_001227, partial [Neisseria gonorrhoeae]
MLLLSAFVLAACNAQNRQSGVRHQDFARVAVDLFRSACVLTQGSFEPVSKFAAVGKEDLSRLPPAVAEPDVQALWTLERDGGIYYLSLTRDSCSVKAERADSAALLEHFSGLVRQPPKNA